MSKITQSSIDLAGYYNRRVVVFGGLGFIGLNLVKRLLADGARVTIVTRSAPALALRWLESMNAQHPPTLCQADLRSPAQYAALLGESEVVFNLAGQSGAAQSLIQAHSDMQSNVEGNLDLLEAVRQRSPAPRVVFVSSRLVYGHTGAAPATEQSPLEPTSIYGLHKLTVEHYYRLYHMHYGVPYAIMRLTNPYGAYQMPDSRSYGVVNSFIMRAMRGETIQLYGDGSQLRDYLYIGDAVEALLGLGNHTDAIGKTFNIGYGQSLSMARMAERVVQVAGHGSVAYVPWPVADEKVETGDFVCDITHAREILGWSPTTDWQSGIAQTIALYRELLP